ncbi:DNA-binding transcriptional regulator, AcrR family [Sinosporangium album]|uniref:DNA-binding transcriptional regulator, AcrR family n=1 Tax=Sinosporangium album TaxID=504805 RepID=A0A1G7V470_9ACTN|nr:TetR/AcrR family transcriptional regulator [Sinosporangium album]SDG54612.1 DNA-binding transcriptional regulator, AcrR family [Sinosporangium album]
MSGRAYRGLSADERQADRRERLISAAYTLYASLGFPGTTIERLCSEARISNRAFYECFSGREELLQVVHDRCVDEALGSMTKSVQEAPDTFLGRIEAGISGYIGFVTQDRRRARIMHLEVRRAGDHPLITSRKRTMSAFCKVIEESPGGRALIPPGVDARLLSLTMLGALQELLIEWLLADEPPATDQLVGTAVHLLRQAYAA